MNQENFSLSDMTKNISNTVLIALAELIITPLVVISADRTHGRMSKDTRCQSIVKKYKSWTRENSFASSIFLQKFESIINIFSRSEE
jgi:hypothetical protein